MMDVMASAAPVYRQPLEGDWLEADLEYLGKCPVCSGEVLTIAWLYMPLGWLVFVLRLARSFHAACHIRYVPGPAGRYGRLIDICCGTGSVLRLAGKELGYQVEGLEIDPAARRVVKMSDIVTSFVNRPAFDGC
jgi:SAM-dependent methyltransferase